MSEEKLYQAEILVIVKAVNEEEAKEKIRHRKIWLNDIQEIEQENLEHLAEGPSRERMRERIFKALERIERWRPR